MAKSLTNTIDFTARKEKVDLRYCPWCGRVATQIEIEQARFDYDCLECGRNKLSDYIILGDGRERRKVLKYYMEKIKQ